MVTGINEGFGTVVSEVTKVHVEKPLLFTWEMMTSVRILFWHIRQPSAENLICSGQKSDIFDVHVIVIMSWPMAGKIPGAIVFEGGFARWEVAWLKGEMIGLTHKKGSLWCT